MAAYKLLHGKWSLSVWCRVSRRKRITNFENYERIMKELEFFFQCFVPLAASIEWAEFHDIILFFHFYIQVLGPYSKPCGLLQKQ